MSPVLRERRIIRMWDQGRSAQSIANKLQLPVAMVRSKVAAFHVGADQRGEGAAIAMGSHRLAEAITRAQLSNQPEQGDIHG